MTNSKRRLKRPVRLVLDYDGTLTLHDTMALLGTLPTHPTKLSWDDIVDAYLRDYEKYQAEKFPWRNYDPTEYTSWLASRKWVEQSSAQRAQDSAFFRGVTHTDVQSTVRQALQTSTLQFRPHWDALFRACLSCPSSPPPAAASSIEILSVTWSATAIRCALAAGAAHDASLLSSISTLPIHANEIHGLTAPNGSSGQLIRPDGSDIRTNLDKLNCFLRSSSPSSPEKILTVYIGDSPTDFDCLCAADLGIWVSDVAEHEYERASAKLFAPLKYTPPMLRSLIIDNQEPDGQELFYWARGFDEVLAYLTRSAGDGGSK